MPVRGRVSISIAGSAAFKAKIAQALEAGKTAASAGLYAGGNVIMEEAKRRSPVDTGAMRGSGYVTLPEERGSTIVVEVGFGGPAGDYAAEQHENMTYRHPVGQAKYLESAMDDKAGDARDTIAAVAAASLGKGPPIPTSQTTPWGGGGGE